jgi:Uma2 family endonuclease
MLAVLDEVTLDTDKEYEIVNGELEEKEMAGARHGGTGTRIIIELGYHVKTNRLGRVYGPDTTFQVGLNDRLPDVSFVAAARIPAEGEPVGKWPFAPDLAVEVVSPNDLWDKLNSKIREYFAAGVRQVWLVAPEDRTLSIYRSRTNVQVLTDEDDLVAEDLFPGLRCPLAEIFG